MHVGHSRACRRDHSRPTEPGSVLRAATADDRLAAHGDHGPAEHGRRRWRVHGRVRGRGRERGREQPGQVGAADNGANHLDFGARAPGAVGHTTTSSSSAISAEPLSSSHPAGTALGIGLLIAAAALLAVGGVALWRRLGAGGSAASPSTWTRLSPNAARTERAAEESEFWQHEGDDTGGLEAEAAGVAAIAAVEASTEREPESAVEAEAEIEAELVDASEVDERDDVAGELGLVEPAPIDVPIDAAIEIAAVVASGFRPDQQLPWEPDEPPVVTPIVSSRASVPASTSSPGSRGSRDPARQLAQRHDRVAAEAQLAFADVHRLRVEALRQAREADRTASCGVGSVRVPGASPTTSAGARLAGTYASSGVDVGLRTRTTTCIDSVPTRCARRAAPSRWRSRSLGLATRRRDSSRSSAP